MRTASRIAVIVAIAGACLFTDARPNAQSNRSATVVATRTVSDVQQWDRIVAAMVNDGELRVRQVVADTLLAGRSHERLEQYYRGVRVFGGDLTRQTDAGVTQSIFGLLYASVDTNTGPDITEDAAVDRIHQTHPDLERAAPAELVILPTEGELALAYRIPMTSGAEAADYFVDAHRGTLLMALSNIRTATAVGSGKGVLGDTKKVSVDGVGSGFLARDLLRPPAIRTYDMRGNLTRVKAVLTRAVALGDGDLASTTSANAWSDPAIVDGHAYAGMVYDFYVKRFGRRGLDDQNLPMISLVHPVLRTNAFTATVADLNTFYLNAFWDGDLRLMVYGDGLPPDVTLSGTSFNYFSGALDIIGHELTHGVTQFTSNLISRNESGALNESFSDMMGTSAEFFFRSPASGPLQADYLMGDDVIRGPLNGIRSLANPAVFGDPDHYSKRYLGPNDSGGIHSNCGISNNAFYLAIEGGTNGTSGLSVQGVGSANRDQIEKVFYRAFAFLLPSGATFSVARAATIQAARDLYGPDSNAERAVTQAWTAVGVN